MAKILQDNLALTSIKRTPSYSLSELFNENTKLHPATIHAVLPPDDFKDAELKAMSLGYKQYPDSRRIKLPFIKDIVSGTKKFSDVIETRSSVRDFWGEPLKIKELSRILFQSYGATGKVKEEVIGERLKRAVPSAGGLYPAEIYLGIRTVKGIDQGIYHYNVPNHELELLIPGDPTEQVAKVL